MIRSLSTAVSGLRNHQSKLDVVGNNIANVNTVGYKYNTALFENIFSQTLQGATSPQGGLGGVNPMQVGLGMGLSSSTAVQTQGALTSTGRESDLAIEGNGFYVVTDGAQNFYTRDGSFVRDSSGVLVNANGMSLMGWAPVLDEDGEEIIDPSQALSKIRIPLGEDTIAKVTTEATFVGNLNAIVDPDAQPYTYIFNAFDTLGTRHELEIKFEWSNNNEWEYEITHLDDDIELTNGGTGTLEFLSSGNIDFGELETIENISFDPGNGAASVDFSPDFSSLTQFVMDSNVIVREQDGFPAGELVAFDVHKTGIVSGTYTNGMTKTLGQIAMASFINPEGLLNLGANIYDVSANSGDARIGIPGKQGRGLIQARALEMSNVDLANEFTQMITTSRAFQANSREISTSDEVLQELVNLKR